MGLSAEARYRLIAGLTSIDAGTEVADAIDAATAGGGGTPPDGGAGTGTPPAYDATEHSYTAADAGIHNILGSADVARVVIVVVTITETFAPGDGAEPTLEIGEEGAPSSFATADRFAGAVAGSTVVCAGLLSANRSLNATGVAGTGTATGAARVDCMTVGVGFID